MLKLSHSFAQQCNYRSLKIEFLLVSERQPKKKINFSTTHRMIKSFLRLLHHNDHLLFIYRFTEFRTTHTKEIAPENIGHLIYIQCLTRRLDTALLECFLTFSQIFCRFVKVQTGMLGLQCRQSTFDSITK